MVKLVEKLTYI